MALGATTCTDNPSGPGGGRRASLALQPVFAPGLSLAAFGISIDSLRVIAIRPLTDTLADQTVPFPADSSGLSLNVAVNLVQAVETLTVVLQFRGGGVPLFSGSQQVEVLAGAPGTNAPDTIPVSYTGPGAAVDSLVVTPDDSIISFNDSLRFRVAAFQASVPVTQFYVAWSTSDTLVARANAIGLVRAPALRRGIYVTARTPSGAVDSTPVTFQPVATTLAIVSGNGQSGPWGTALAQPVRVRVTALDGLGVREISVTFAPPAGGTVTPSVVVTDTGGFAQADVTLGPALGPQTVVASAPGLAPVSFNLTALVGAISAARSLITVSTSSLVSGATATLTLQGKDAAGNNVATGGAAVIFSASGGTSTGTIGGTTDNGNGTYTATFTSVLAGSATIIGATINGNPVTTAPPTIAVTAGAVSAATSTVTVGSGTIASGAVTTLTLQAKDAAGNALAAGGATVGFTASGGTSTGTIGATTDNGNGTYSATFTGVLAGAATTIGATINGGAVTTTLPTITVTVGAISTATSVVTSSSGSILSGTVATLTLQGKDAAGNLLTTGGATVVFSFSGGSSTGTIGATTDNGNGTYTAAFTGVLVGSATTIGATINTVAVTSTLPTITVTPGAISTATSVVTTSSGTVASGASATLTLQAKDAAGNLLTTGGATVVFSFSGGTSTGTIGTTVDNGSGTYTASFLGVAAGTATTISATINAAAAASTTTITVVPGNSSSAQSVITVSSGTVASGGTVTLTLQAKDGAGNPIPTGGSMVIFSLAGGTSTGSIAPSPATDNGNGTYTATLTAVLAGTATTVNATLDGSAVTSTLPTITVTPGAPSAATSVVTVSSATLASGAVATLTLQAKDAAGNNLNTGGASVAFSASGGTSTGSVGATSDNGDGTYTATFTGILAGTPTTIGATINGSPVTTSPPTITVTPGVISATTSTITVGASTLVSGTATAVTLQGRDAAANAVVTGGATVVFAASGGTSVGGFSPVSDNGDGTYTATFTGTTAGSAVTISATINGSPVTTALPTITVTASVGAVSWWTANGSATDTADGNNGALVGGTTFGPGLRGQAFDLNGSTALVDFGNAANLRMSAGDFTVDAWVNLRTLTGDRSIVDKMSGFNASGWRLIKQGNGFFWFCLGSASNGCLAGQPTVVQSATAPAPNTWYHVAAVKSAGGLRLFVNGVLEATAALPAFVDSNAASLVVGATATTGTPAFLDGLVDEVQVFNRALAASEIDSIYQAGLAVPARLAFTVQPTATMAGALMTPAVQVAVQNALGTTLTTDNATSVTLALVPGTGTAGAALAGNTTATAVAGVATFANLSVDSVGTGYRLSAAAAGLTADTSAPFDVTVSITTHATDITADETWSTAQGTHIVTGYLRIRNGATLTIADSATVKFDAGAGLQVGDTTLGEAGGLVMQGTPGSIHLTANTASPTPGFWQGIEVQRSLPVPTWKNVDIEWGGGARANPFNEACVLIANASGAPLDIDSVRIRQCVHAGIHHFGGVAHVHEFTIDSVTGSGIHADFDAQLEIDSGTVRGAGQEGLFIGSPLVRLGASSANQFRGNAVTGIHLHAEQLPGLLRQDSLVGNGTDAIEVEGGQPDPGAAVVTLFRQPRAAGPDYHFLSSGGVLDVGRVGGQELVLDSGLVAVFDAGAGIVIGDSAGTRSGTIRSLGTDRLNAPRLTSSSPSPAPGDWYGLELGRLSADTRLANVRIEYAGDSIPGRTTSFRTGLVVRNAQPTLLDLDSIVVVHSGKVGQDSGGVAIAIAGAGTLTSVRRSVADSNAALGIGLATGNVRITDDTARANFSGFGVRQGTTLSALDSIAGNVFTGNTQHPFEIPLRALPALYTQSQVTGNGRDSLVINEGGTLGANARFEKYAGAPWLVRGGIVVDSGAVLTIDAGDTVAFAASASLEIGTAFPATLLAVGTAAQPILLTSEPPAGQVLFNQWIGIGFASLDGSGGVASTIVRNVIIEHAGGFVFGGGGCRIACEIIPVNGVRYYNGTANSLTLDSITVRLSNATAVEVAPAGASTLTILNSQFYNNAGLFKTTSGAALTIHASDIYHYGGTVVANNTGSSPDSVNATDNWWGDVAGLQVGFSGKDSLSLGQANNYQASFVPFATAPFFPVGAPASVVAVGVDSVQSVPVATPIDSIRARVLDANGRGVPGVTVNWSVNPLRTISPTSGPSDIGGRTGTYLVVDTVAETDTVFATIGGTPAQSRVTLLPGPTVSITVDWQVLTALSQADSFYTHPGAGTDTVVYSSSNHFTAVKTNARDVYGNVTQPSDLVFAQGPCATIGCRFPAADSTKGDTIFFRPSNVGDYVLSGLYEGGLGGSDQVVLRVTPVAARVRIDRDVFTAGVQDTGKFTFNSQCRFGAPVNFFCGRQFTAYVVDSGGAPIGNTAARFSWISPGDTTITVDSTPVAPVRDMAFASAHANGTTYLVAADTSVNNYGRDSMPVVVQQFPAVLGLSPASDTLVLGDTTRFTAIALDQGGDSMPGVVVHWRDDPFFAGTLKILDTSVVKQVKVQLDSTKNGIAQITGFACCGIGGALDTLFVSAQVHNPVQVRIALGSSPFAVALNRATNRLYVTDQGTGKVYRVDAATETVTDSVRVGAIPQDVAANPTTNKVYATSDSAGASLAVIDGTTHAILKTLDAGSSTDGVAIDTVGNRIFVGTMLNVGGPVPFLVTVDGGVGVDTFLVADTVRLPGGSQPHSVVYNPAANKVYVQVGLDSVVVVNAVTYTISKVIALGTGSSVGGMTVNPVTNKIYVANSGVGTMSVIDGTVDTVATTVSVGLFTNHPGIDLATNRVFVPSAYSVVFVIDGATDTLKSSFGLTGAGSEALWNPANSRLYVTVFGALLSLRF